MESGSIDKVARNPLDKEIVYAYKDKAVMISKRIYTVDSKYRKFGNVTFTKFPILIFLGKKFPILNIKLPILTLNALFIE